MGDKSRTFVIKAVEVATQNPDFLPRAFDLDEMRRDVKLFKEMYPIVMALTQLQTLVDDTTMESGSETYAAALQVYGYVKASDQVGGLEGVVSELGQWFNRKTGKPKSAKAAV